MLDRTELPPVTEANLDEPTLQALVEDLISLTSDLTFQVKGGELAMSETSALTLEEAVESLKRGELRGIQVRYGWQGEAWMDTLLRGPGGIRVVRMKATRPPS